MALPALKAEYATYQAIGDQQAPVELVLDYDDPIMGLRRVARTYSHPAIESLALFPWVPLAGRAEAVDLAARLKWVDPGDAIASLEHRVQLQLVT
jgi:hypothetical protein